MTVAVSVKVFDGIVLAADSATTMSLTNGAGEMVSAQVYNNANKIFHLHRNFPIGAATWGLGSIGSGSIAGLAKDLRLRFMGEDPAHPDWALSDTYTVEQVAHRMVEFFHGLYSANVDPGPGNELGFVLAGYGGGSSDAELWRIDLSDPTTQPEPTLIASGDQAGWVAFAQSNAMNRLFRGYDDDLAGHLIHEFGEDAVPILESQPFVPAPAAMPFMDAIALAGFMVDVTSGYSRFQLGHDSVGGPSEVAGISRHEGFKWVSRKHYFNATLNPQVSN